MKRFDRRTLLKRTLETTGVATLGAALMGGGGCGDQIVARGDGADATEGESETASETASETESESETASETESESETEPETASELPGPEPALRPLRGDGSHPFHYLDTIVIVQLENRSFDHYFGARKLVEGKADVDGLSADVANLALDGTRVPVFAAGPHWIVDPDPPHSAAASNAQFADGLNAGFVTQYEGRIAAAQRAALRGQVMGYMTRDELPQFYALADAFTLCDRWHCGLLGPTWPNRFFSHAASSGGATSNLLPLAEPTIYTKALAAGLSYGVYHQSPIYFALTMLDPVAGSYREKDVADFFPDAAAGTLPNLTVVEPDYGLNDDHPPHDGRLGQAFVASIYEALRQSPQWERSLMLVFYDEHGGFYDHVPPPPSVGETRVGQGFDRLGFRVPGLVISPLVRRGQVFHELLEHSSVPGLISRVFGLPFVNERSRLAGDFADAFDLDLTVHAKRPPPPVLPEVTIPSPMLEAALHGRCRQEELVAYAAARGIREDGYDEKRRRTERWLEAAVKLGAVRVS